MYTIEELKWHRNASLLTGLLALAFGALMWWLSPMKVGVHVPFSIALGIPAVVLLALAVVFHVKVRRQLRD